MNIWNLLQSALGITAPIRFNVKGFLDRRTEPLWARNDELFEKEWRRRVARNPKEMRRLDREARATAQTFGPPAKIALLRRQAS